MKLELQENMYVRTKYGRIAKIEYIEDNTAFCDNWLWQSYEEHIDFINLKDEEDVEDIIKASFNVIDILKCGDYVNGEKVIRIFNPTFLSLGELPYVITKNSNYEENEITSIVTYEQMEQMSYKLGE